jgi:hypothetical protein
VVDHLEEAELLARGDDLGGDLAAPVIREGTMVEVTDGEGDMSEAGSSSS